MLTSAAVLERCGNSSEKLNLYEANTLHKMSHRNEFFYRFLGFFNLINRAYQRLSHYFRDPIFPEQISKKCDRIEEYSHHRNLKRWIKHKGHS
jgi:hypothetical protein